MADLDQAAELAAKFKMIFDEEVATLKARLVDLRADHDEVVAGLAHTAARLAEAERLLRDVRGTLRTDQHDGHRRIGSAIDKFLRATDSASCDHAWIWKDSGGYNYCRKCGAAETVAPASANVRPPDNVDYKGTRYTNSETVSEVPK